MEFDLGVRRRRARLWTWAARSKSSRRLDTSCSAIQGFMFMSVSIGIFVDNFKNIDI